jgi:hypothetical protein
MSYHTRCEDEACTMRCRRPGCIEPQVHFFAKAERQGKKWVAFHTQLYGCTVPRVLLPSLDVAAVAKQAIEELNPNMTPSDVAVARKVIGKMLDRLEQLEHTVVAVVDPPLPLLLTAPKTEDQPKEPKRPFRPEIVAAPRATTHAKAQHQEWLAQRKERTA